MNYNAVQQEIIDLFGLPFMETKATVKLNQSCITELFKLTNKYQYIESLANYEFYDDSTGLWLRLTESEMMKLMRAFVVECAGNMKDVMFSLTYSIVLKAFTEKIELLLACLQKAFPKVKADKVEYYAEGVAIWFLQSHDILQCSLYTFYQQRYPYDPSRVAKMVAGSQRKLNNILRNTGNAVELLDYQERLTGFILESPSQAYPEIVLIDFFKLLEDRGILRG